MLFVLLLIFDYYLSFFDMQRYALFFKRQNKNDKKLSKIDNLV